MTALSCGCVPLAGGGVAKLCDVGYCLLVAYQQAIERAPGGQAMWWEHWRAWCAHLGQEARA